MPGVTQPVFLSYASEDSAAAERIAETLRAAGIEVWLDQSELRGGDVWDTMIRGKIRGCPLPPAAAPGAAGLMSRRA